MQNPTIVFQKPGVVQVEDREMPELRSDDVLIKTENTLISTGTELAILEARYDPESAWSWASTFPRFAGYSNVGTVVDRGNMVGESWTGKRVVCRARHAAYVRSRVPVPDTPFIPEGVLMTAEIPDGVASEDAAYFALALIALNAVRRARIELGFSVAVFGTGPVGQLVARFSALSGARRVFGIDREQKKLVFLPDDAVFVPIDAAKTRADKIDTVIRDANHNRLVDIAFEATGNAGAIVTEPNVIRQFGRLIIVSSPQSASAFNFNDLCLKNSISIIGCHENSHPLMEDSTGVWTRLRNVELFFSLLLEKAIDVRGLTTDRIPYVDTPSMYQRLRKNRSDHMGVILQWQ